MSLLRYPEYKHSGVRWLGDVPEHWHVRSLKQIVSIPITDGPHETPEFPDVGVPFVSAEAVSDGFINFDKKRGYISLCDHERFSKKYSPELHDIYMVKSGATTGVTAIVEKKEEFNIWSPLAAIRCNKKISYPYYVLNFLRSRNFQDAVTLNWSFGTQQNIGMGVLGNLSIAIPPLVEQTAIATFLGRETGKIDALIAEQARLLTLLVEKRQATISHAVTKGLNSDAPVKDSGVEWLGKVPAHWDIKRLKHLGEAIIGLTYDPSEVVDEGEGTLVLRSSNVQQGRLSFGDNVYVKKIIPQKLITIADDILICSRNGSRALIGKNALITEEGAGLSFGAFMTVFRSSINKYLYWVFNSQIFSFQSSSFLTATINQLTTGNLYSFAIPLPPMSEQVAISEFLAKEIGKINALTTKAEQAIELLKERRSALISAAVTGQIDVRQAIAEEVAA